MARDPLRGLVFRLTAVAVAVLLGMAAFASWTAFGRFDPVFTPELARKASTVGGALAIQIERALSLGIPLERLAGVDQAFADEIHGHPEIAYVALTAADGRVLAQAGGRLPVGERIAAAAIGAESETLLPGYLDTALPLRIDRRVVAQLHVGVDAAYLAKASLDLMLDVMAVLVVSVLLTFEILLLVVNLATRRMSAVRHVADRVAAGDFRFMPPARAGGELGSVAASYGRMIGAVNDRYLRLADRVAWLRRWADADDPQMKASERALAELADKYRFREPGASATLAAPLNLVFLRLPVFLFCLSEELSRPFLPAYAQTFADTVPGLSPDLVVSAPITLFMLVWAISQPGGARWSERWGRRRSFIAGALLGAVGLAMTAYAATLYDLLLWRCMTALGYGLVLITAQGIVVDHTDRSNRASGMASFIGALLAAGVCGPVTGGILADQLGFRATFIGGAVLAVGSGVAIAALLGRRLEVERAAAAPLSVRSALGLARNLRFVVLMLLSAIPTKIAATGVLFCLVPMLLAADGASKAEVGRVQMMYFVVFILVSPIAANLSDRWEARRGFIALGGLGTLVSCVPLLYTSAWWAAPLAIAVFGLSQALVSAPQLTLVSQLARDSDLSETAAIGWYRLLERLGGAAGPMIAMGLAVAGTYLDAMVGISLLCGGSAILFWICFRGGRLRPPPQPAGGVT